MNPELYACALNGDVGRLKGLMLGDEHILESSETANSKGNNILHIAAIYGHVHFAREVLNAKQELSSDLNEAGLSPLHLATAKGHLGLVKLLLDVDPDLSSLKDKHGRLPAHTAAMKGRVDELKGIITVNPWCLKKTTDKGDTVLHLSVKHDRIQVVKFLMEKEEVKRMVNEGDCSGNTALHLAAARNRKEIIGILMDSGAVNVHAKNKYNITAYDLIREPIQSDEIVRRLNPENNAPAAATEPTTTDHSIETAVQPATRAQFKVGNVMIVASLIATVTFQSALTHPGGFWQDNAASSPSDGLSLNETVNPLANISAPIAGTAILPATAYDTFMKFDTLAFVCSFFVILFVLLNKSAILPQKCTLFLLLVNLCLAIIYLGIAFYYAIDITKPRRSAANQAYLRQVITIIVGSFVGGSVITICVYIVVYVRYKLGQRA